jgi:hypothetical protein
MARFGPWPLLVTVLLGGCVAWPREPGVVILPGGGKSVEQFREDHLICQHYAQDEVRATPERWLPITVGRDGMQSRYDLSYVRCMSFRGHGVPPPP